jgi:hypothetical protein
MSGNSSQSRFGRRGRGGIRPLLAAGPFFRRDRGKIMRIKALAVVVLLLASAALFVQMRKDNRADAAASNCYSDAKGPSAPTICS